jgi:cell wall assembly regulator SMI1
MPVAEALERLLRFHDAAGSPIRRFLRPALAESTVPERLAALDVVPHPQLQELYRLHDGVDEGAWNRAHPGVYALLVPDGVRFPSTAVAVDMCRELRDTDAQLSASPLWDLVPGDLWRPWWFPVFALTRSDENVAIDCDPDSPDFGRLWVVRWNAAQERIVAGSLEEFLVALGDRFVAVRSRWDENAQGLDHDEQLAGELAWP